MMFLDQIDFKKRTIINCLIVSTDYEEQEVDF